MLAAFADPARFASFLLAAVAICVLPGSTVTNVISTGLARGVRAGIAAEIGAQIGRFIIILLVAVAVEAVTAAIAAAFDWIKYLGAAYLVWLGIRFILTPPGFGKADAAAVSAPHKHVLAGIAISLTNPKAYLFFGAFLPQFADRNYPLAPQIIALGLVEMAIALVVDGGYLFLAVTAREKLNEVAGRRLNQTAGVVLIGAAVWLALQHRP